MSLTDEDKTWISSQLDSRTERLETKFDRKLDQLETNFNSKLDQLETKFDNKLEQLETKLDSKLERLETTLLTEFHKWASPNEARLRTHTAALRAIDLELEAVSDRVTKLEDQRPH